MSSIPPTCLGSSLHPSGCLGPAPPCLRLLPACGVRVNRCDGIAPRSTAFLPCLGTIAPPLLLTLAVPAREAWGERWLWFGVAGGPVYRQFLFFLKTSSPQGAEVRTSSAGYAGYAKTKGIPAVLSQFCVWNWVCVMNHCCPGGRHCITRCQSQCHGHALTFSFSTPLMSIIDLVVVIFFEPRYPHHPHFQ